MWAATEQETSNQENRFLSPFCNFYMEKQRQFPCPLHPEIIKDVPGRCPKCGMNLVLVKAHSQPEIHAGHPSHHVTHQQASYHPTPYNIPPLYSALPWMQCL